MRLFFFFILCVTTFALVQAQVRDNKNILLLNSYHVGFQWTDDLTKGVKDAFEPHSKNSLFVEYLDSKRFEDNNYFLDLVKLYKYKYNKVSIDGIICADDYAFEFFLNHGNSIWDPTIPVSFCGINHIDNYEYDKKKIKGIKENIDVQRTLSLINSIQPNVDTLILISDFTFSGFAFLTSFWEEWRIYEPQIPYKIIDGSNYEELQTSLENISPTNKAIILLSLYLQKDNVPVELQTIGSDLFKDIDIPIYSFWDFLMDDFIIGGSVVSGYEQGFNAAQILQQRINDPLGQFSDIMAAAHHVTIDYNMLKKHGLNPDLLPNDIKFVNKKIPFHIRYKKQLAYFVSAFSILIAIIFILISNIAKRKIFEQKLLESEERLELALNGANEGMWDIQLLTNKIVYSNNYATLLGYESTQDLILDHRNWHKQFRVEDAQMVEEAFTLHINGISPLLKLEVPMYMCDGSLRYFSISGKITARDINNTPIRMTGVIKDISLQKEFERQLKVAKEKAEESDRLKSSFLANMSHEIRTPMNAILGFSDIIMSHDLNESETKEYLGQIKNSGENLLNIINDIVDFSKIESGQLSIRKEQFDLNILLNNVMYAGKTLIKARNKPILLTMERKTILGSMFINSDPFRLEQILLNLISNAVKFTDEGGIVLNYTSGQNGLLTFTVSDTGQGISMEDQQIIFERFRQADNSKHLLHSGTGLGLSITRSLVQMMGGSIWVNSELDKGSTFSFTVKA